MPAKRQDYSADPRPACIACRARLDPAGQYRCPYCGAKQPAQPKPILVESAEAAYVYEHSANSIR